MDKVSLIIPVYNVEKYISRCIDSLLRQDYSNIEIIVVDDGSKDNSSVILEEYVKNNNNLFYYKKDNEGVSIARNYGISKANGKYLIFVDSDDFVSEDYVSTLVEGFKDEGVMLSIVDYYIQNDNDRETFSQNDGKKEILSSKKTLDGINDNKSYLGYVWNKCFLKDVIIENNLSFSSDYRIMEDHLFCIQYIDKIKNAAYTHKPVYMYYQRENSAVREINADFNKSRISALEECLSISLKYGGKFENDIRTLLSGIIVSAFNHCHLTGEVYDKKEIKEITRKIKSVGGNMSLSHKVMYLIMRFFPRVAYTIINKHN